MSGGHHDCEYEDARRVTFDFGDAIGRAVFVPTCMTCHRFVKPNEIIRAGESSGLHPEPNAVCKKCGPTRMHFEGFM